MAARDYEVSPATDDLSLNKIIAGLTSDLDELRAGKISVNDAIARSMLAKQIFNGVRIYLNATKMLSDGAKQVEAPAPSPTAPASIRKEGRADG